MADSVGTTVCTTSNLRGFVASRFAAPEWCTLFELAIGNGRRYVDAIAFNLWGPRGYQLHGFEMKVSRGDWLRELKNPAKAEDWYRWCDRWWLVAPKGVIEAGELPATWGHLEVRGSRLVTVVKAPELSPNGFPREVASRPVTKILQRAERPMQAEFQRGFEAGQKAGLEIQGMRESHELESMRRRMETVTKFEAETGVSLERFRYRIPELGRALKVLTTSDATTLDLLERWVASGRKIVTQAERDLEAVKEFRVALEPETQTSEVV